MEENNQNNINPHGELNQAHAAAQADHAEIEKEIEAINNSLNGKGEHFGLKVWLCILTAVFSVSMLCGLYIIFHGPQEAPAREEKLESAEENDAKSLFTKFSNSKEEGAAVVKIRGVIQESNDSGFSARYGASSVAKRIRTLADKKEIKALLLDVNSPGGTVASVQDIYDAVLYFKSKGKPVVALFRDVAASGGFYIAMAADKIIAQPGTMTGSIGVIMQASNFEGLMDKIGVKFMPIKSGKHKDIGSAFRPMTDEEAALLQEMINDTYQQFYDAVKKGRPNITDDALRIYADGRIFTGSRAKAIGLIDELGGEDKAKEIISSMTDIKNIKLLSPRVGDFFDIFTMSAVDNKLGLANKIEEINTPKVSYLWTY
jgi:protease-4